MNTTKKILFGHYFFFSCSPGNYFGENIDGCELRQCELSFHSSGGGGGGLRAPRLTSSSCILQYPSRTPELYCQVNSQLNCIVSLIN